MVIEVDVADTENDVISLTNLNYQDCSYIYALFMLFKELEEENFVITSLLNAAEEGNVEAIQELADSSSHFDVNVPNRVIIHLPAEDVCLLSQYKIKTQLQCICDYEEA
jgi:hypothetical protein